MNEMTFEEFCVGLRDRAKKDEKNSYTEEECKFLWDELKFKSDDVKAAILEWVKTGTSSDLSVPQIIIPKGFWPDHTKCDAKAVSASMLMDVCGMNYIAASLTIDWVRRAPRDAMRVLHKRII